jgi:RNA polymerase sigma factor (sigma-70 family)
MNRNHNPPVKTIPAWCGRCDRKRMVDLCHRGRAINPECECGSCEWSRRPVAQVRALVEANVKLAYYVAARSGIPQPVIEIAGGMGDCQSQAVLYLIKAAHRWDEDFRTAEGEPVRFTTFASACIKQNLRNWITRELGNGYPGIPVVDERGFISSYERHVSVDYRSDGNGLQFASKDASVDAQAGDSEELAAVRQAMRKLPARIAKVMGLHYAGLTYREIGKQFGISTERVRQLMMWGTARVQKDLGLPLTGRVARFLGERKQSKSRKAGA